MTTERIDHVAEAKRLMAEIADMDPATQWMVMAQKSLLVTSHVGLAAVEQERIANLIALSEPRDLPGGGRKAFAIYDLETFQLREDVREGLGL